MRNPTLVAASAILAGWGRISRKLLPGSLLVSGIFFKNFLESLHLEALGIGCEGYGCLT